MRAAVRLAAGAALAATMGLAAGAAAAPVSSSDAEERELDLQIRAAAGHALEQRLASLDALRAQARWRAPRWQAVLAVERCSLAPAVLPPELEALAAADPDLRVASIKCRQWMADDAGDPSGSYESARQTWTLMDSVSTATLRFRIARDYADEAAYSGILDKALIATGRALDIARKLADAQREAVVLMTLSMVQSDLGRHDEALANSDRALALDPAIARNDDKLIARSALQLHAQRYEDALATTKTAVAVAEAAGHPDARLAARVNMTEALLQLGRSREALALSAELLPESEQLDIAYIKPYVWGVRAFALAAAGQVEAGIAMRERALDWFERGGDVGAIERSSRDWARQMAAVGRWRDAYAELSRSTELRERTQRNWREKNAELAAAMIDSSRKDLDIERLQHQAETARLQQQRWIALAAAVLLSAASLLFVHLRLRRSNRALRAANAALAWESTHDALTRAYNRRYFVRFFDERRARGAGRALLVLLDVDHFKAINDCHGHAAGDQVLEQISQRLRDSVRGADRVVRWGGEEFLIFIDEPAEAEAERALVLRLLDAVAAEPVELPDTGLAVSASIGFASVTLDDDFDIDAAISDVDSLLYLAKRGGRRRAIGRLQGPGQEPVVLLPPGGGVAEKVAA